MTDYRNPHEQPAGQQSKYPVVAVKAMLAWYMLQFSTMIAAAVWVVTQIVQHDLEGFHRVTQLFGVQSDPKLAALIALTVLFALISLLIAVIHLNIGRLGVPELTFAGRLQGGVAFALLGFVAAMLTTDLATVLPATVSLEPLYLSDVPTLAAIFAGLLVGVTALIVGVHRWGRVRMGGAWSLLRRLIKAACRK